MAILEMSKMSIVAHHAEKNKILRALMKTGFVETVKTEQIDNTEYKSHDTQKEEIESKLIKINFALTFLKDMAKEYKYIDKKTPAVNLKKDNELISLEDYETMAKEEYEVFNIIENLSELNNKLIDLKSEKQKILAHKEQLVVYNSLPIKFSEIKDTLNTAMIVGTVSAQKSDELLEKLPDDVYVKLYEGEKLKPIVVICHKENQKEIRASLALADFAICSYNYDLTAQEKLEEMAKRLEEINQLRNSLIALALEERKYIRAFKILYDFYFLEFKKNEVMENCSSSSKTFVLEAWAPKEKQKVLEDIIDKKCKYAEVVFRAPYKEEIPPTMTRNNKFADPYEALTKMYGSPNHKEVDPNIFVAIFFFIIFGFMFSDAGYGIVLAVSCFAYYFIKKPVKKSGRMILLFGLGGISTIIWGAIFGGWFGMTFPSEPLIDPLDSSGALIMLGLAIGIGAVQIATGFIISGINNIKDKNYMEGIFGQFGWAVIFLGVIVLVIGMLFEMDIVRSIGLYVALAGVAMMLLAGAIGKKNPIKMIFGALGRAYGSINIVSDLLSYSRLFGIGLTTGVIGFVVNQFAVVIVGFFPQSLAALGWVMAVPVLLIGHLFNFGINLLGVYVHNTRLQYIEFFQRFYQGNGHEFVPLGSQTKYTYFNN